LRACFGRYTQAGLAAVESWQTEIRAIRDIGLSEAKDELQISHDDHRHRLLHALKALVSYESAPQPLQKLYWAAKVRRDRLPKCTGTEPLRPDIPIPDMSVR
jgi:hypothetical protein